MEMAQIQLIQNEIGFENMIGGHYDPIAITRAVIPKLVSYDPSDREVMPYFTLRGREGKSSNIIPMISLLLGWEDYFLNYLLPSLESLGDLQASLSLLVQKSTMEVMGYCLALNGV